MKSRFLHPGLREIPGTAVLLGLHRYRGRVPGRKEMTAMQEWHAYLRGPGAPTLAKGYTIESVLCRLERHGKAIVGMAEAFAKGVA